MIAGAGGASGWILARRLEPFLDNSSGSYTVYWPTDKIRVFESGSYEMALFFAALLRDERTTWYMRSASEFGAPEISLIRRDLSDRRASQDSIKTALTWKRDRLVSFDIWFRSEADLKLRFAKPDEPHHRLDMTTVPNR